VSTRGGRVEEVISLRDAGSPRVDVRVRIESEAGHITGVRHIPLRELADRAGGGRS